MDGKYYKKLDKSKTNLLIMFRENIFNRKIDGKRYKGN